MVPNDQGHSIKLGSKPQKHKKKSRRSSRVPERGYKAIEETAD
jgi:hypothetical protein